MNASQLAKTINQPYTTVKDALNHFKKRLVWFAPKNNETGKYELGEMEVKTINMFLKLRKSGESHEESFDFCVAYAHEAKFGWYKKGLGPDL